MVQRSYRVAAWLAIGPSAQNDVSLYMTEYNVFNLIISYEISKKMAVN